MGEFQHLDFFVLRTPKSSLKDLDTFLNLSQKQQIESYLKLLFSELFFKDALFLSSEQLFYQVERWLNNEIVLNDKLFKSLYKYVVRFSSRCTPFGHYAGIVVGGIVKYGQKKAISIQRNLIDQASYRIDMQYLHQIVGTISKHPAIKSNLYYSFNNTIYKQGDYYKFYQHNEILFGSHFLNQVRKSSVLDHVITSLKHEFHFTELIQHLKTLGASQTQAIKFAENLIDSQFIYSEIRPVLTSDNTFLDLLTTIKKADNERLFYPSLLKVEKLLRSDKNLHDKQYHIKNIISKNIPTQYGNNIIQGDLLIGTESSIIDERVINKILKQLEELLPLTYNKKNEELENFKLSFRKRYDGQMISLLELLDPDTGIGYGNLSSSLDDPLLKNFRSPIKDKNSHDNILEDILIRKNTLNSTDDKIKIITIEEHDLVYDSNKKVNFSPTLYAIGNLLTAKNSTAEPFFCLQGFGGNSAGNLIARFAYLSPELQNKLKEIGYQEQDAYSNAIVAEIIHIPESRTGNILQRPNIRTAEIALLAKGNSKTDIIEINNLYVLIKNDRLVLWSKELNKEVIPRLTSAHNFKSGINLYRFLSDLQSQENSISLKWQWEKHKNYPFLPRIIYKNIILSRARWNISKITNAPNSTIEKQKLIENLVRIYNLPQRVILIEGDNELPLDFSNPISLDILFEKITKHDIILSEFVYSDLYSPVHDQIGSTYSNELIIPVKSSNCITAKTSINIEPCKKRNFVLGDEWIYVKIYSGKKFADELLKNTIPELIQELKRSKLIKKWFFIRYQDPDNHLRLRFEVKSNDKITPIIPLVNKRFKPYLLNGTISNIQYDTYRRELERYTPAFMGNSETLFFFESESVLTCIKEFSSNDRWQLAIQYIDSILEISKFSLNQKIDFTNKMRFAFSKEFNTNKSIMTDLNRNFREKKFLIETLLSKKQQINNMRRPLRYYGKIVEKISLSSTSKNELFEKIVELIASYIHMYINRFFPSEQRQYEYIVYHFLNSYYLMLQGKIKRS